jgi:hypothetical protein
MRFMRTLPLLLAAMPLVACLRPTFEVKPDSGIPVNETFPDAGPELTFAEFCQKRNVAVCDEAVSCGFAASREACLLQRSLLDCVGSASLIRSGFVAFSPEKAVACLSGFDGGCSGFPDSCASALTGTSRGGQDCWTDKAFCEGNFYCEFRDGRCPGSCVGLLDAGQSSIEQRRPCGDGLVALGPQGVCTAPVGIGQACSVQLPCGQGICRSGLCVPAGRVTEACALDTDCGRGLYCLSSACSRFPTVGDRCDAGSSVDYCAVGSFCSSDGFCRSWLARLSPCREDKACTPPLRCISNRCDDLKGAGEACVPGACERGTYCAPTTMVCSPVKAEGEPCSSQVECGFGCGSDGGCLPAFCVSK